MSAFLSSADAINALATYWYCTAADWSLARALRIVTPSSSPVPAEVEGWSKIIRENGIAAAIFHLLLAENIRSLQHAYPLHPEMWATDDTYKPRLIPCVETWADQKKTGGIAGILQGYIYQSCEHPDWRSSIAREICTQTAAFLLRDFCDSTTRCDDSMHFWASWTESQD